MTLKNLKKTVVHFDSVRIEKPSIEEQNNTNSLFHPLLSMCQKLPKFHYFSRDRSVTQIHTPITPSGLEYKQKITQVWWSKI